MEQGRLVSLPQSRRNFIAAAGRLGLTGMFGAFAWDAALRIVADGVNQLRAKNRAFLVITHYQRLLSHIVPDTVHVMSDGRIVRSGGKDLALELEEKGYGWIDDELVRR